MEKVPAKAANDNEAVPGKSLSENPSDEKIVSMESNHTKDVIKKSQSEKSIIAEGNNEKHSPESSGEVWFS